MRSCNLRPHCLCALAIRSKSMAVYFDRCTKGFLQVWAKESALDVHVHGIDVMSRLEGRIYQVRLPDGAMLTLDPLLTQVNIMAKQSLVEETQGLCRAQTPDFQIFRYPFFSNIVQKSMRPAQATAYLEFFIKPRMS